MSDTRTHKIEGKFKNGLIDLSEVPENVYSKWNRKNFERGRFRAKRKELINKSLQGCTLTDQQINAPANWTMIYSPKVINKLQK